MRKFFRTILLAGVVATMVCGCKYSFKFMEEETTTIEVMTEATTEIELNNTEKMEMLLGKSEISEESLLTGGEIVDGLILAVPKDGIMDTDDGVLITEKDGLCIELVMNPEERSGLEDYPVYNSLRNITEQIYDSDDYLDVEMESIEDVSVESARVVLSYLMHNDEDEMAAFDATWYLVDLNEEQTLMIHAEVCYEDVTENTEKIINELEEYYEIKIKYDEVAASDKIEAFINNDGMQTVTYNNLTFDIPSNWAKDTVMSEGSIVCYAPDGNVESQMCGIMLQQQSGGFVSDKGQLLDNKDQFLQILRESTGMSINNLKITDAGESFIGGTVKVTFDMVYAGTTQHFTAYIGLNTSRLNMIAAFGIGNGINIAEEVLEDIMKNGSK